MTGYQETFTDPSYHRQILIMTHVHTGNYGTTFDEVEALQVHIAGVVIQDARPYYSRVQAMSALDEYLAQQNIPGITGVDTRALVRHIRTKGAMRAILSTETQDIQHLKNQLAQFPSMEGWELASEVSTREPYLMGTPTGLRVAVMDYGVKHAILRHLVEAGCFLKVFPARTPPEQVLAWAPQGILLSNGPGDPAAMDYAIHQARTFLEKQIPILGICLGHQILALASGLTTYKMHHGHRGINHAVLNRLIDRAHITTQNHGFAVREQAHPDIHWAFINLNDKTIEGFLHKKFSFISVQFHPEASPGPHDTFYLFRAFVYLMHGLTPEEAIRKAFAQTWQHPKPAYHVVENPYRQNPGSARP